MPQDPPNIANKALGDTLTSEEFNMLKNCVVNNAVDAESRLNSYLDPSWGSQYKGADYDRDPPSFVSRADDDTYRIYDEFGVELYSAQITDQSEATVNAYIPIVNAILDAQPENAKLWILTHIASHLELAKRTSRPNHHIIIGSVNGYGKIGYVDSASFLNIKGTAEYPIVFTALVPRRCRITYPSHARLCRIWECEHVCFHGIDFTDNGLDVVGTEEADASTGPRIVWGLVMGQAYSGETAAVDWQGNTLSGVSHNLTFDNCKVGKCGQSLFVIASSSYNIAVRYCTIHGSGYRWGRKHNAEGIYIGSGGDATQTSTAHVCHDIYIKGCEFYDIGRGPSGGEAIDMKNQCYNITVEDCGFNGVNVDTQGCITVNHGYIAPQWSSNNGTVNVLIHRNVFSKITRRTLWDSIPPEHPYYASRYEDPNNPPSIQAQAIHVGKNGVYVIDNTFNEVADHNISTELTDGNISGTTGIVLIKGNKPNAYEQVGALTGPSLNVVQE